MELAESDFIVLGFLLLRPMTGYELKTTMDATTGHFYRSSFGGIYPSLKKLARAEYVAVAQSTASGKLKKIYRPLPPGKKAFQVWLKKAPDIVRAPGSILIKMFFLGLGDRQAASSLAQEVARLAARRAEWLEGMLPTLEGIADSYQKSTCQYGMDYYRFMQHWFEKWERKQ
jgi:DNA-binding PadR family transcriptional regulator